jgi:hypothetical protein
MPENIKNKLKLKIAAVRQFCLSHLLAGKPAGSKVRDAYPVMGVPIRISICCFMVSKWTQN